MNIIKKKEENMKILINLSNYPSEQWAEEQKLEWDKIFDIPFPEIDPFLDTNDLLWRETIISYCKQIEDITNEMYFKGKIYLMLQGEFTFCYDLFLKLKKEKIDGLAIPATKREIVKEFQPDNSLKKIIICKFIKWRLFEF